MDYKQFVNSTINRLDQPSFDAVKKALVGEYLSFSFINEDDITREILSEKVVCCCSISLAPNRSS